MYIDEVSYDILEWFPILYCKDVFKHLSNSDLIQASEVNKEWNKLAAESLQVQNLKLVFGRENSPEMTREAMEWLLNSKRKYQHIEMQWTSPNSKYVLPIIAGRVESWKSMEIDWCRRGEDVENLYQVFGRCTNLVKLHWPDWFSDPIMLTLLRNNPNLKDLALTANNNLFEHSPEYKFQLRTLCIYSEGYISTTSMCIFLETQAQSLEFLEIEEEINRECLELILNRMPKLTSLKVCEVRPFLPDWPQWPLPENTAINSLELSIRDKFAIRNLIRALPGLKHFKCPEITADDVDLLAQAVPALESIEVQLFNVAPFPEDNIFPNINHVKVDRFLEGTQEPTGDRNFAALVREEMRKFFAGRQH